MKQRMVLQPIHGTTKNSEVFVHMCCMFPLIWKTHTLGWKVQHSAAKKIG